jgi:hypothetical protein
LRTWLGGIVTQALKPNKAAIAIAERGALSLHIPIVSPFGKWHRRARRRLSQ